MRERWLAWAVGGVVVLAVVLVVVLVTHRMAEQAELKACAKYPNSSETYVMCVARVENPN